MVHIEKITASGVFDIVKGRYVSFIELPTATIPTTDTASGIYLPIIKTVKK